DCRWAKAARGREGALGAHYQGHQPRACRDLIHERNPRSRFASFRRVSKETLRCGNGEGNAVSPRFVDRPKSRGGDFSHGGPPPSPSGILRGRKKERNGPRAAGGGGGTNKWAGRPVSGWGRWGRTLDFLFLACLS